MNAKRILQIILLVIAAGFIAICFKGCSAYNTMVEAQNGVDAQWSNVETQYQRRADLIPNLVETVKGYSAHEQQTLTQVTEARAKATSIQLNAEDLNEETLAEFSRAQSQLNSALKSLLAVSEAYPDLKANENFLRLQDELAGTENRIQVARKDYNQVARDYNTLVQRFPNNLFAKFFGFNTKPYFKADEAAATAPTVKF